MRLFQCEQFPEITRQRRNRHKNLIRFIHCKTAVVFSDIIIEATHVSLDISITHCQVMKINRIIYLRSCVAYIQ